MKRMMRVAGGLVAALVCTMCCTAKAEDFKILSFNSTGQLTFNEISTATVYRVEWAPTPAGPWTNNWDALAAIQATGSGIVTCSVPMCYRVVVSVTNGAPSVPDGMVQIPGGTNAGTDPDYEAYSLTVEEFFMDATEVTKAKWDEVYAWAVSNGYSFDNTGSGKASDHPVQTVNWYDCVKWCNARSQKEGRTPCYTVGGNVYQTGQSEPDCNFSATGYRLPTVTEWKYAARGGLSDKRFPWGDTIKHSQANYFSMSSYSYDVSPTREYHPTYATGDYPYTSPAGALATNGYGLHDMAGNVWEWCNDEDFPYRRMSGGCWNDDATPSRCGHGGRHEPDYADYHYGFRAVCR